MTKTKAACRRVLVRRLEEAFRTFPLYVLRDSVSDLYGTLGIEEEEAELMGKLGVFGRLKNGRASPEAVLRFFEEYGRGWFLRRFERQLDCLRETVKFERLRRARS